MLIRNLLQIINILVLIFQIEDLLHFSPSTKLNLGYIAHVLWYCTVHIAQKKSIFFKYKNTVINYVTWKWCEKIAYIHVYTTRVKSSHLVEPLKSFTICRTSWSFPNCRTLKGLQNIKWLPNMWSLHNINDLTRIA